MLWSDLSCGSFGKRWAFDGILFQSAVHINFNFLEMSYCWSIMAAIFLIRNIPLMILFGNGKYIKNYCNVSKRMNRSKQGVEGVCFSAVECSPPPPKGGGRPLESATEPGKCLGDGHAWNWLSLKFLDVFNTALVRCGSKHIFSFT